MNSALLNLSNFVSPSIKTPRGNSNPQLLQTFINRSASPSDSDSYISEEENTEEKFNKIFGNLMEHFYKNKFRNVFSEIDKNEVAYYKLNISNELVFTHLQIRCAFEIIDKKFYKYYNKQRIKGMNSWLNIIDNLLFKIQNLICSLPVAQQPDQFEILAKYNLLNYYNNALYCYHQNKFNDSIAYLSLSTKLINSISKYITNSKIIHIIEKIYLFKTMYFISDRDFQTAIIYLGSILRLCFREIDLLYYNYLNNQNKKNFHFEELSSVIDINFNLVVCFYQLGFCYEKLNDVDKAELAYQQSKYFSVNFIKKDYFDITKFIQEIAFRIKNFKVIINCIQNFDIESLNSDSENEKKKICPVFHPFQFGKVKKFQKIQNLIEHLKINEIDDDEKSLFNDVGKKPKSKSVVKMTKNIKLLNYLTSSNFKSTIVKMNKIELNKMNKETKNIIQKKISSIKMNQKSELRKYLFKKRNNSYSNLLHSKNNFLEDDKISLDFTESKTNFTKKKNLKNSFSFKSYSFDIGNKPFKLEYDKYIFNKNYRKKINYLETLSEKELNFQKEILNIKKIETLKTEPFELEKIKRKAELFYNMELDEKMKNLNEKNQSIKQQEEYFYPKIEKMRFMIEERTCKSLNIKERVKYINLLKRMEKKDSQTRVPSKFQTIFTNDLLTESETLNHKNDKINKEFMNQLEVDIDSLNKKEIQLKKEMKEKKRKNCVPLPNKKIKLLFHD